MTQSATILSMGALAGALGLDTTAAVQAMVSEPLVAGTIAGAVAGDPMLGVAVGASLQLVWAGALPVGAAPFPDSAPAAVAGAGGACALTGAGVPPAAAVASALVVAFAAGAAGQRLTVWLRRRNDALATLAETRAAAGDPGGVRVAVALGLGARFALSGALAVVAMCVLLAARPWLALLPAGGRFPAALWLAPIGACAVAATARGRLERMLLGAGFAAGLAVTALV